MRIACGKESERPLSRFPLRGKAGAGGFPPRRKHASRQHKTLARILLAAPPTRGAAAPLVHPPPASGADALYVANRTFHLLIKPDNLTCYQQSLDPSTDAISLLGSVTDTVTVSDRS